MQIKPIYKEIEDVIFIPTDSVKDKKVNFWNRQIRNPFLFLLLLGVGGILMLFLVVFVFRLFFI